jgi:hypothetical protein
MKKAWEKGQGSRKQRGDGKTPARCDKRLPFGQGEKTGEMAAKKRSTGKGTRANKKDLYKRGSIQLSLAYKKNVSYVLQTD